MNKNTRRIKVSFGEGVFEEMQPEKVINAQRSINKTMKGVVRDYKRNEMVSKNEATQLVLNA